MPELPEVEILLQGIKPFVEGKQVEKVIIRENRLRWPIPNDIKQLEQQTITQLLRRGKYLLFITQCGTAILHLGMSGAVVLLTQSQPIKKHDHFDLVFKDFYLRYNDPRRFGAFLWTTHSPFLHPLIEHLGKEPLEASFNSQYLYQRAQSSKTPIKVLIMNSKVVVGIGNIYATESLFIAGIHPLKPACLLTIEESQALVKSIKKVLIKAIQQGGTTLKDFINSKGKPGYFQQHLQVYGRAGLTCLKCGSTLQDERIQQRATVFCPYCQS